MEEGEQIDADHGTRPKMFFIQEHRIVLAHTQSGVLGCDGSKERLGYADLIFRFIPVSGSHIREQEFSSLGRVLD